jgi:hypothetical protein
VLKAVFILVLVTPDNESIQHFIDRRLTLDIQKAAFLLIQTTFTLENPDSVRILPLAVAGDTQIHVLHHTFHHQYSSTFRQHMQRDDLPYRVIVQ